MDYNGSISWMGVTYFVTNTANYGGALFTGYDSSLSWTGQAHFKSNHATTDGGGIASPAMDAEKLPSSLTINGPTTFVDNNCGVNGGAIKMVGDALSVTFVTSMVTFSGNVAGVAGGAVHVSGAGIGPQFVSMVFVSNVAQIGGGVYATGSGTTETKDPAGTVITNPTTFDRCKFFDNMAWATGGAIESGAGVDVANNSVFVGNTAGVGGALRLAGTATLNNCSFLENSSDDGGGPAVSNIGFLSNISHSRFYDNVFMCNGGSFLDKVEVRCPIG